MKMEKQKSFFLIKTKLKKNTIAKFAYFKETYFLNTNLFKGIKKSIKTV